MTAQTQKALQETEFTQKPNHNPFRTEADPRTVVMKEVVRQLRPESNEER